MIIHLNKVQPVSEAMAGLCDGYTPRRGGDSTAAFLLGLENIEAVKDAFWIRGFLEIFQWDSDSGIKSF